MRIERWPSGSGATVRVGRLHLEVWEHGGVTRCEPDNSAVGYCGTHYARVARASLEQMAAAAVELWRNARRAWSECL